MKKIVSLVLIFIAVLFISSCEDLFNQDSGGGTTPQAPQFAVVSNLSVSKAPLEATFTWQDPSDEELARIKVDIDPVVQNVSLPLYINAGVETLTVTWPQWTGLDYEFTFTGVQNDGTEHEPISMTIQPGIPEREYAPPYLEDELAYPLPEDIDIQFGTGFDSTRGKPLSGCALDIDLDTDLEPTAGGGALETTITLIESTSALETFVQESTDLSVGASGSWGPVNASVSVNVSESRSLNRELNSSNTNLLIYKKVRGPGFALRNTGIEFDETLNPLSLTPAMFFDLYGDRYAYKVLCGYDLFVLLEIETESFEEKEEIAESLGVDAEAGAYGVSATVSVDQSSLNSITSGYSSEQITVTQKVYGWNLGEGLEGITVDDIINKVSAYHGEYSAAVENNNAANSLWTAGTVEVHYRNYFNQLSNSVPTYPNLALGDATLKYRQLILDHREAIGLQEKFWGWYGLPHTWEDLYIADSVDRIENTYNQILSEVNRLQQSLNTAKGFESAEDFQEWSPAEQGFNYDTIVYEKPEIIPGGNPPSGYTIYIPETEINTISGTVESGYYTSNYEANIQASGLSLAGGFSSGELVLRLPADYSYYVAWEELQSLTDWDGCIVINGVEQITSGALIANGNYSFTAGPLGSYIRLRASNQNQYNSITKYYRTVVTSGNIFIYRKSTSITDPGGGGPIVTFP